MAFSVAQLLSILDLERIEEDIFRGRSPEVGWQRVFGGLVIAQALTAMTRTVQGRFPHSLHGYFVLPGDPAVPIIYEVDRQRDGGSFSTRRCVAIQHGQAIFSVSASYQRGEEGFEHAAPMPEVPPPDELAGEAEIRQRFAAILPEPVLRYLERERPIEMRPVDLSRFARQGLGPWPQGQAVWMRATSRLPDDPAIHCAVLAYLSDMTLLDTALLAQGRSVFDPDLQVASLDHALWFHRPFRADEWMLYSEDSPSASGGRGFTRGQIFAADGRLVASAAQEGLIRRRGSRGTTPLPSGCDLEA